MELLIGKGDILIDAFLSEATLPRITLIRIPEYLAGLVKLSELSNKGSEDIYSVCLTTSTSEDESTFRGCCELCTSAIGESGCISLVY